jgi:hypothetical protein
MFSTPVVERSKHATTAQDFVSMRSKVRTDRLESQGSLTHNAGPTSVNTQQSKASTHRMESKDMILSLLHRGRKSRAPASPRATGQHPSPRCEPPHPIRVATRRHADTRRGSADADAPPPRRLTSKGR